MKPQISKARTLLVLLLSCAGWATFAQEISLSWATTFGHKQDPNRFELGPPVLLSDANGDTRVFGGCHGSRGTFRLGTNVFPATVMNGEENADVFMARLDSGGTPASVKLLPSTGPVGAGLLDAANDQAGNVVLVLSIGTFGYAGSTLAEIPLPANGGLAMVKVDSQDTVVWARMFGSRVDDLTPGGLSIRGVAVDRNGNIAIGGYYSGLYSIDGVILDSGGGGMRDFFVAKFSPEGNVLWVRTAGGVEPVGVYQTDWVEGVATDSAGNVFIGGTVVNGASFGGQIVNTVGDYDVFVARYDPDGDLNWVFTTDSERFQALRIGRDDKPILVHVGGTDLGGAGLRLTVLDGSGHPESLIPPVLKVFNGPLPFVGMEVDDSNNLRFIASLLWSGSTLQFGNDTLTVGPDEERLVFAGSLRLDGTWNWLRTVARPRYATNATPERYFLPGPYAWPEMRGFAVSKEALRFAGVYLSPEAFPLADGTLPPSARYDSQYFIAELAVKPSPPSLRVTTGSNAALVLSWPTTATGFVLQSATTLANGGDWQDFPTPPTEINDQKVVTIASTGSRGFFRLRGP